ncbi:hypothetical protein EXT46_12800 [Pseudoalteromonas sp. CO325X]|uniref:hypothetical protein n=1 Tax=Pseudoalteromonas sp. CO325X TaxID=1777262 RepID=UPI001022BD7E|nr:hypothetical protein [Pseudoalteromonas sp. CO325X]RZF80173.1 hypothetical protein EXT46_12800 [Pseudoalteromonas sp. CO325X]
MNRESGKADIIDLDVRQLTNRLKPFAPEKLDLMEYILRAPSTNNRLSDIWPEQSLECNFFANSKNTYKDINPYSRFLVLTENAYQTLRKILEQSGECLKLNVEGVPMVLFNPLVFGNEDPELTVMEYEQGVMVGVKKLIFKKEVENLPIFKSKYTANMCMYCNEEFRNIVKENGFEGICFQEDLDNIF